MEQGGGFFVSSQYGGGRQRGASLLLGGSVVVKPKPSGASELSEQTISEHNIPPPAAFEDIHDVIDPNNKPPSQISIKSDDEIPTHIRRGTGVLAGIKPMNYRDQKLMSDLKPSGMKQKRGDIDYMSSQQQNSGLEDDDEDDDEDEESTSESAELLKKKIRSKAKTSNGNGSWRRRCNDSKETTTSTKIK